MTSIKNMTFNFRFFLIGILLSAAVLSAQTPKADISTVVASGKMRGDTYENAYFGIMISAPKAKFTTPSLVNAAGHRARLLNLVLDSGDGAKNYTIGLMADSLENYPNLTPNVYLRSVRHSLERDGLITDRQEFPITISGVSFVGAMLKVPEKPNFGYYRGIYSTFLNGYVVSLEVQARTPEHIQELLSSAIKISSGHKQ